MKKIVLLFFTVFCFQKSFSQGIPIGGWRIFAALEDVVAIADAGDKIYCASHIGLFSVDKTDHSFQQYSKATGMSDVGISTIAWHENTKTLIVAYTNSNIDLLTPSGVVNINDIQQKSILGDKTIYQIVMDGNTAYLACGFGVINFDMVGQQINDTYFIGDNGATSAVTSVAILNHQIWVQMATGLKYADLNSQLLSDFQYWTFVPTQKKSLALVTFNNNIYSLQNDSVMRYADGVWQLAIHHKGDTILRLKANTNHLIISERKKNSNDSSQLFSYDKNFSIAQNIYIGNVIGTNTDLVEDLANKAFWAGDIYGGMFLFSKNYNGEKLVPNANHYNSAYAFAEKNNAVWVAGGLLNGSSYTYNPDGFYSFANEQWTSHDQFTYPALDSVLDLIAVAISPDNTQVYFASLGWGLVQYTLATNEVQVYKNHNSALQAANGDGSKIKVGDVNFDSQGNLWMTNNIATQPIVVKKADGTWKSFTVPQSNALMKLIVDKTDQKWMTPWQNGIVVYNSGADIDNTADDQYRILSKGVGYGNLPSNNVYAMAEDNNGQIWVGTDAGVAVFYDEAQIFSGEDAQQIIVTNPTDSIANYLFAAETVTDIKVDGANRKWVCSSHGVWLMSADGITQIYHFTKDNSPLLSDVVYAIGINNTSGEVFFSTDAGMCSFKSDATVGGDTNSGVYAYPNPVPHNYGGTVAIKGLVNNASVKITDINGQLIYSTKAMGGQAVWNGQTLQGTKTASGVYLVFATNDTGAETVVTKILYDK